MNTVNTDWSDIDEEIRDKVILRLKKLMQEIRLEKSLACDLPIQDKTVRSINDLQDTIEFYIQLLHDFVDPVEMAAVKPHNGKPYHKQIIMSVLLDETKKANNLAGVQADRGYIELYDRLKDVHFAFTVAVGIVSKY